MTKQLRSDAFSNQRWRVVQELPHCQILQNHLHIQVERYSLKVHDEEQLECYRGRINASGYWVGVLECRFNERSGAGYVVLERVQKLGEIGGFSFWEAVCFLKEALKAYLSLEEVFGKFQVTEGMLGMGSGKEVKMWVNQDLSSNRVYRSVTSQEEDIVRNLALIVSGKLRHGKQEFLALVLEPESKSMLASIRHLEEALSQNQSSRSIISKGQTKECNPLKTDKRAKTSDFQCQVDSPHSSLFKSAYIPLLFPKQTNDSTPNEFPKEKKIQKSPTKHSTSIAIRCTRRVSESCPTINENLLPIKQESEQKEVIVISGLREVDINVPVVEKSQYKKASSKTFPLGMPVVESLEEVPSQEVIRIEQSVIILRTGGPIY